MQRPWGSSMSDLFRQQERSKSRCKGSMCDLLREEQRPRGSGVCDLREEQRSRGRCKGPGAAVHVTYSEKGKGAPRGQSKQQEEGRGGRLERSQRALQTAARPHPRQSPVECCQQGTPPAHLIPGWSSQPPFPPVASPTRRDGSGACPMCTHYNTSRSGPAPGFGRVGGHVAHTEPSTGYRHRGSCGER